MGIELANVIKERMQARELTYDQTAELAGISRTYIAKILQGSRNPDDPVLLKLADVLQMDRKELLFVAHRDRAPEEAKSYFGERSLKSVKSLPKMFLDLMPSPDYVDENRYSRKYIDLAKQTTRWAKEAIEKESGFTSQFREAQKQVANWMFLGFRDPKEAKKKEKLFQRFEHLNQELEAYRKKEEKKKELLAMDLPLVTDEDNADPTLSVLVEKKKIKTWKLAFEKSPSSTPFVYQIKDEGMIPLLKPNDHVIGITGTIEKLEDLIGKVVITKVKELGTIVRYYNRKDKSVILTALNPSFPPHILSRNEIEWLHPVKGIYRFL
jgi:transcriptional regulator with XRE-family HTH domain